MFELKQSEEILKDKRRLRWACRRGMVELDVLFLPFTEEVYDDLDERQQALFRRLLTCDDPDLFAWIMGHQKCEDEGLKEIIQVLLARVKV
ncbi:antitoxin CptB [Pseudidiomarina planktonica]|uniref:FAD assembly factor SdhE n=1 Tax=Pseudidiomarina planktonica TaxID=1323738 RepID=A0A1Y6ETQ4_9GAMM|nr:succinate dehydrogenase assembly factor 2 [Pseudidiomarina planktonica]RUO65529.1 succinate dehydrogenase assembly factor 2 family protein [Pseudidiomarina planktonica]SMQ64601.1 antitoxin CptB [Pseudidiomarina planktonica]